MKKYVLTIIVLCTGFLCLSQINTTTAKTSFNGFHCNGKPGLCSIDNINNRSLANTTLLLNSNNELIFTLDRKRLSVTEQKQILGINPNTIDKNARYYFKIPHSYPIPSAINQALTTKSTQLVLAKGTYLIDITEEFYTITFTLH